MCLRDECIENKKEVILPLRLQDTKLKGGIFISQKLRALRDFVLNNLFHLFIRLQLMITLSANFA